jgi:glycosyltransferase involved in cell wall biosynthesis
MAVTNAEYLFITSAPLYEAGGKVTAYGASARLGTIAPARSLGRLGYDARAVSVAGDLAPVQEMVKHAKRIVFGEMFKARDSGWAAPIGAYRTVLADIRDARARVVFGIADDHFDDPEFAAFYREALPRCRAVTVVSQALADTVRAFTSSPVLVAPEPTEGARGTPQAVAARRVAAPLTWLARRVGLSMDHWRVRLLWFGYPWNLPPLLALVPALERYAARYPLFLTCITSAVPETLVTPERTREDSRLRVHFVPWSPLVMDAAIAAADLVLIPSEYRDPRKQAKSPNRLVAGLHGGRFVVAHPLPAYAPYAGFAWIGEDLIEGIDWAVRHPREVVERIARGQAHIDARHSPEAVARFWLDVFHPRN